MGSKVCLGCHSVLADTFSHTMMGRLQSQGKLQCETCHGPGSAHVRSIGCAACHGDGGITTRPGFPSLVGQSPEYLVAAMKAYVTGQRKHVMMKTLLSGLGDAEINNIAVYYARQTPARAATPPVGDPAAGRAATGLCANCHGERGISVSPAFPSLAGQDALYLADALRAYKDGSRNKTIACAGCHGDGGISRKPGIPSLVGLDAQYLVAAMKAYVTGQRKNAVMKALLAGVGDAELNGIAHYYAAQAPARAQTPSVGDAAAGRAASAACAGCHGEQGVSANPAWPSLAGQDARYLADALKNYKDGSRSDEIMKGMAAVVDERTMNDIASYYASLAPAQPHSSGGAAAKHDPVAGPQRTGRLARRAAPSITLRATTRAWLPRNPKSRKTLLPARCLLWSARQLRPTVSAWVASFPIARTIPAERRNRTTPSASPATSAAREPSGRAACTRRAVSPAPIATPS